MHTVQFLAAAATVLCAACAPTPSAQPAKHTQSPSAEPSPAQPDARTAKRPSKLIIPDGLDVTAAEREAIQTLGTAELFGGWAVGYGGIPSPPVAALRTLLAEPHAAETLRVVVSQGSLEGQLMAVSGLYYADPDGFEAALAPYREMHEPVALRSNGCMVFEQKVPVADLVETKNPMKITGPEDTLEAWHQRNPKAATVNYDIAHGGYPINLARGYGG